MLEIRTNRAVDELIGGAYHSVFKGRGIEFDEVREYTPDDDVRDIDWNVTARMNAPYIKKYVEERELNVMLALDVSASGAFGSCARTKRERAAEIAALLAFSAAGNGDKAGLLLFSDRRELMLPPKSGRKHALRMIRDMLAFEPQGRGTDIVHAIEDLNRFLTKRSVVFLISDFLGGGEYEKPLKILNKRHDVIAVRLRDRAEKAFRRYNSSLGLLASGTHWTRTHVGKSFMGFLALVASESLRWYARDFLTGHETCQTLLGELRKIQVWKGPDGTGKLACGLTKKQKEIFECLGMDEAAIRKAVAELEL